MARKFLLHRHRLLVICLIFLLVSCGSERNKEQDFSLDTYLQNYEFQKSLTGEWRGHLQYHSNTGKNMEPIEFFYKQDDSDFKVKIILENAVVKATHSMFFEKKLEFQPYIESPQNLHPEEALSQIHEIETHRVFPSDLRTQNLKEYITHGGFHLTVEEADSNKLILAHETIPGGIYLTRIKR